MAKEYSPLDGHSRNILDLCATVPIHFVIADGIVAMEGNGPLNGTPRPLGTIALADDLVAADATCARLMGFEPERIAHIRRARNSLVTLHRGWSIEQAKFSLRRQVHSRWFPSFSIFMHFVLPAV